MENKDEELVRIKLEKHQWPDEIAEKKGKLLKKIITAIVIVLVVLMMVVCTSVGFYFGLSQSAPTVITNDISTEQLNDKFSEILNIMSNKWYFAKEDKDIVKHTMDKAYYGMTDEGEIDPHTTYMSSEEIESFTKAINMNFVGIGVQFFNADDFVIVKKVFKHSPAEESGVLAGDIFNTVDGQSVSGKTNDEIAAMVKGKANTKVSIEFLRQGEPITIDIVRAEISATTYGEMVSDNIGYIELYQFGNSTSNEVYDYLTSMSEQGLTKLIIDLRDNGGGYLDALQHILNYFLPPKTIIMRQEHANGSIELSETTKGEFTNIKDIVILVNGNTASASEVMTMALKEQRQNVTIVGTKTFGKGTVQVTESFSDGSALKYTTSKWMSPSGVWVNKVGIEPDVEVKLPKAISTPYGSMEEGMSFDYDSVSIFASSAQSALEFLGYQVDRTDGYLSAKTKEAIKTFQTDHSIEATGILDKLTYEAIYSAISKEWAMNNKRDPQYQKALELLGNE